MVSVRCDPQAHTHIRANIQKKVTRIRANAQTTTLLVWRILRSRMNQRCARGVCGGIDVETGYVDVDDDARSYFSPRIGSAIGADISFPMVCARRSLNKSPVRFLSRQALLFKANEVIVPTVMHAASNSSRSRHYGERLPALNSFNTTNGIQFSKSY